MTNAIIMASGMGTRMRPLTDNTPKPLIKVLGRPMAETVIDALQKRGVDEIFVVVGYLGEQFAYLTEKYPNVRLIWNDVYRTVNNISSVYFAREVLKKGDCFVCEADLFVADEDIFAGAPDLSCYYGKMVKGRSDDWVFDLGEDGFITRVGKGGTDAYNMTGAAFLKAADAAILADAIEEAYGKPGYEDLFWDDVVDRNLDRLRLRVHPVADDSIVEIDNPAELEEAKKRFGGKV